MLVLMLILALMLVTDFGSSEPELSGSRLDVDRLSPSRLIGPPSKRHVKNRFPDFLQNIILFLMLCTVCTAPGGLTIKSVVYVESSGCPVSSL